MFKIKRFIRIYGKRGVVFHLRATKKFYAFIINNFPLEQFLLLSHLDIIIFLPLFININQN